MRLTPEVLRNLYSTFIVVYPFTKWKLPLPEEIDFQVDKHDKTMLWVRICMTPGMNMPIPLRCLPLYVAI